MLDTFSFFVYFATAAAVLFAVGYLLYKVGHLKQAIIALVAVLLLGGVAIASGHAEEATVISVYYEEDIAIVEYNSDLLEFDRDDLIPVDEIIIKEEDYDLVGYDYSKWYRVENRGIVVAEFLYEDDAVTFAEKLKYGRVYCIETIM